MDNKMTCTNCGEYAGSPIADRIEALEVELFNARAEARTAIADSYRMGKEAQCATDAEAIKAAEELAECLQYADIRIAWEAHGLGNGFAERVEVALADFLKALQARAEKGGE